MRKDKVEAVFEAMFGIFKTLRVNFKCLPFKQAVKLPIVISHHVYLRCVKGKIVIQGQVRPGMITIGIGNVGIFDKKKSRSVLELAKTGTIVFRGGAFLGNGVKLSVAGTLELGKDFRMTAESTIFCNKSIRFGDGCLVSWENLIFDTDVHKLYRDGERCNEDQPVVFGDRVWIGCRNTIIKGTVVPSDVVIGAGSFLSGTYEESHVVLAGVPAKTVSTGVSWER